jgi:hypothetical protein
MFAQLLHRWRPARINSVIQFTNFLDRNAWLVAQKSVIGYCTVKTMLPIHELIKDKPFADAYDISIREAYAAALADLMEIGFGYLNAARPQGKFDHRLVETYRDFLERQSLPASRSAEGWGPEIAAFRDRLATAATNPRRSIRDIAGGSAARIAATLPIHERLRQPDVPAIKANVEFLMVGIAHEFERIDYAAIADELTA